MSSTRRPASPPAALPLCVFFILLHVATAHRASPHTPATPCFRAHRHCMFKFANTTGVYRLPLISQSLPFDQPISPRVVHKNSTMLLGVVNVQPNATEIVMVRRSVPMGRRGNPRFSKTQFKLFADGMGGSSVGVENMTGNQMTVIEGKCVRVWIGAYQVVDDSGNVVGNHHADGRMANCLAFRVE